MAFMLDEWEVCSYTKIPSLYGLCPLQRSGISNTLVYIWDVKIMFTLKGFGQTIMYLSPPKAIPLYLLHASWVKIFAQPDTPTMIGWIVGGRVGNIIQVLGTPQTHKWRGSFNPSNQNLQLQHQQHFDLSLQAWFHTFMSTFILTLSSFATLKWSI